MRIKKLAVADTYVIEPVVHTDSRGSFWEWYRFDQLEEVVGHKLELRQANASSSSRGVLRGLHFADVDPGQAKYVTCQSGVVIDYVVDIRTGSPTFGKWDSVRLDEVNKRAVFISEGIGHAFVALTDNAVVSYLVSGTYDPAKEHSINPLDPEIGLVFPNELDLILSEKDLAAPTFSEASQQGILPSWESAMARYEKLNVKDRTSK